MSLEGYRTSSIYGGADHREVDVPLGRGSTADAMRPGRRPRSSGLSQAKERE